MMEEMDAILIDSIDAVLYRLGVAATPLVNADTLTLPFLLTIYSSLRPIIRARLLARTPQSLILRSSRDCCYSTFGPISLATE